MKLWQINAQTPYSLSPEQEKTLDAVCMYLQSTGRLRQPHEDVPPVSVAESRDGLRADTTGALFRWHDVDDSFWQGWVREDGQVGAVEQDVIDVDSEDPVEVESHWERREPMRRLLRDAVAAQAQHFELLAEEEPAPRPQRKEDDLIGFKELAEMAGIKLSSARAYHSGAKFRRKKAASTGDASLIRPGDLPEPDRHYGQSPVWKVKTIRAWMKNRPGQGVYVGRHGRQKPHIRNEQKT